MALLTPLNVNCHASDGRKVRAKHVRPKPHKRQRSNKLITGIFCVAAPQESH